MKGRARDDERIRVGGKPSAVPTTPLGDTTRVWRSPEIDPSSCILELDEQARLELAGICDEIRNSPLPVTLRQADHFQIPHLRQLMAEARNRLDHGIGVVVLDRLPLDEMEHETALAVSWALGSLIGRQVAQKWDGTMLYDVTDKGLEYGYGVRASYTSVELVFHTDNAFGMAPPSYVALLCIHPASEGGISRFCSLVAVHDRLLETEPRLLERLYQPMLWDRQAEHAEGAPKVSEVPMFRHQDGRLLARVNPSLVRQGYTLAGREMDEALQAALEAFQRLSENPEFWFELPIERGQLPYLDNRDIAHYRSSFRDPADARHKRHLVRTWHRDQGRPSYDG